MTHRIQSLMSKIPGELDAVLIASPVNRRYFTGFPSSAGILLLTREESCFIIDSRYYEAAQSTIKGCRVILQEKLKEQIGELLARHGVKAVGLETDHVSIRELSRYRTDFPKIRFSEDSAVTQAINALRQVKDEEEIACIQRAQQISDRTFAHILEFIAPGKTEREVALEMEFHSRQMGSEEAAFPFIVVSGSNSSRPHGVPTHKPIEPGDFVTMDFGATIQGYRSDMTRTVAVDHVSDRQRLVYGTVLEAQLAAMEHIRAGAVCREVDKIARDLIETAENGSFTGRFGHGLGHSLGLDVHESPSFSPSCETVLEAGMVMSVEPGIYLPGEFGVRIEDIVQITGEGFHNLATSTKELLVL